MNSSSINHGLMKNVYGFVDQRKQTIREWLQDPNQSNVDNLNNVTREAIDISGKKKRKR
jgi:hypothetical protein